MKNYFSNKTNLLKKVVLCTTSHTCLMGTLSLAPSYGICKYNSR